MTDTLNRSANTATLSIEQADGHAHICSKLAEQYKSDPVLFAALTDAAAIIHDLMRELRRETERRLEGNRRAAQEYVDGMHNMLKEAAQICKDLDDEAQAKEGRPACGAECAAAIADLAATTPYNRKRIAWELERTAMGDGYYADALRAAKEFPEATLSVQALLNRWLTGKENGLSDRTDLCAFALQIYLSDGEPERP